MGWRRGNTAIVLAACALWAVLAAGCSIELDPEDGLFAWQSSTAGRLEALRACGLDDPDARLLDDMRAELDDSVHELIKCGQLQAGIARNLVVILMLSNESLFHNEADFEQVEMFAEILGIMPEAPLANAGEGRWTIPIGSTAGSHFELQFFEPGADAPVLADPFVMDSYLVGVEVESSMTLDEMIASWETRNTFTFSYEATGPLSHLLGDGEPIDNPFEVRVSVRDLLSLGGGWVPGGEPEDGAGDADFGPLESLASADMRSSVRLRDQRSALSLSYDADGARDTLANVASAGVAFDLDGLQVEHADGVRLVSEGVELDFVPGVGLAGALTFEARGLPVEVRLHSDYGEGTDVPRFHWSCD